MAPPVDISTEKERMRYSWFFTHNLGDTMKKKMDDTMCDDEEEGDEQPEQNNNPLLIDDAGTEEVILDVQSQLEVNNSELEKQKFSLKIKIPGNKEIHKSTLVSLLNNNPEGKISKDRLTRVASTYVSRQNKP